MKTPVSVHIYALGAGAHNTFAEHDGTISDMLDNMEREGVVTGNMSSITNKELHLCMRLTPPMRGLVAAHDGMVSTGTLHTPLTSAVALQLLEHVKSLSKRKAGIYFKVDPKKGRLLRRVDEDTAKCGHAAPASPRIAPRTAPPVRAHAGALWACASPRARCTASSTRRARWPS